MAKGRCRQGFKVGMVKICFQVKWATTPSVPCRTSTTTIHAQCSLPDLNREYPRQVFPAGPHVGRYGTKNVQKKVKILLWLYGDFLPSRSLREAFAGLRGEASECGKIDSLPTKYKTCLLQRSHHPSNTQTTIVSACPTLGC